MVNKLSQKCSWCERILLYNLEISFRGIELVAQLRFEQYNVNNEEREGEVGQQE